MHRETCVKGFSRTTAPRILEFYTNIGYHYLHHVRQIQHPHAYHSLYSFIFLSFNKFFCQRFLRNNCTRISKFCTNIGCDLLYHMRESASLCLSFSFFVLFSFSPIKSFCHRFLSFCGSQSLQFCLHLLRVEVIRVKENKDAEIYFAFCFPFFLLSISHSMSKVSKELLHL